MKKMAQQIKQCAQCMKQGNKAGAAKAMAQMQQQMQQMQQQMNAEKMMKEMQMQLQQAKNQMNCKACNGGGCKACKSKKPGNTGKGKGGAPDSHEEADKTTFRDSKSPMNIRQGQAVIVGFKNGINRKGEVRTSISEEMSSSYSQPADPLTSENLPRNYREMAEDYFRILRDGD